MGSSPERIGPARAAAEIAAWGRWAASAGVGPWTVGIEEEVATRARAARSPLHDRCRGQARTTRRGVCVPLPAPPARATLRSIVVSITTLVDPLGMWPRAARLGSAGGAMATDAAARAATATLGRTLASRRAADTLDVVLASALSRTLASRRAADTLDVVLASALADRAVRAVIEGPLVDLALRTAVQERIAERIADQLIEGGAVDRIVDRLLSAPLPQRIAERLLADGVPEQIVERALAGPELERLVDMALESPRMLTLADRVLESEGMERLVAKALDSRLLDTSVARVLASEELWLVVEEIARSPAVTAALTQQGAGLADQLVEEVGARSRRADARLERIARRVVHRHPATAAEAGTRAGAMTVTAAAPERGASQGQYVGLVTRAIAFAVDAALINVVAILTAAVVALAFSVVRIPDELRAVAIAMGGTIYLLWTVGYFTTFWTTTGQTPGSRMLRIRVRSMGGESLRPARALLRFAGLMLAALPLFAGFLLILVDDRRRGLQDLIAAHRGRRGRRPAQAADALLIAVVEAVGRVALDVDERPFGARGGMPGAAVIRAPRARCAARRSTNFQTSDTTTIVDRRADADQPLVAGQRHRVEDPLEEPQLGREDDRAGRQQRRDEEACGR